MSDIAYISDPKHRSAEPSSPVISFKDEPISTLEAGHYSATTISDSDQEYSSSFIKRRPPQIITDTLCSSMSPPSLISSNSRSSLSTDHYAPSVPITPLTSSSDLAPSDLAMIDERYSDDQEFVPENRRAFSSTHELLVLDEFWSQQKPDIHLTVPKPFDLESPSSPTITIGDSDQLNSRLLSLTPGPGMLRSPSTISFARFLSRSRKHSLSDEAKSATFEEKRRNKAMKKEQAKAKKERLKMERQKREEKLRKLTLENPLLLGPMLAVGQ